MKQLLTILCAVAFALLAPEAQAQNAAQLQKLYEAGKYQQVVESALDGASPETIYTIGQAYERLNQKDKAKEAYQRLADHPDSEPWHFIGLSARDLLAAEEVTDERDSRRAIDMTLAPAEQAATMAPTLPLALYQLAIVHTKRGDWSAAAAAFEKVTEMNPANAYAHYYAGMTSQRAGRADRMAIHFEQFLKLAPDAPERAEVVQTMRTVRGR